MLNERSRRRFVAAEASLLGRGGIAVVARATGISRGTIGRGLREIAEGVDLSPERVRRPGGGRKRAVELDPTLADDLDRLVDPATRGDPGSRLRWTSKSVGNLVRELQRLGHTVSEFVVAGLLREMGYSLQFNRKSQEGGRHPDRNAQFEHINESVVAQQKRGGPAVSIDTKKKEIVGNFKNGGREWSPKGEPEKVRVHDFMTKELGKVAPYGVYDMTRNAAWVSVGITHDTAQFAVATIERWWRKMGKPAYPTARSILITADGGGSNSPRVRLWKWELQKLANRTGLQLHVHHFPPGTSKWNKIEHRLFAYITKNWRGRPLISHAAIVNLIGSTTTSTGLKVRCELDRRIYHKGVKVSDDQMAQVCLTPEQFHGEWNYTISPSDRTQ